MTRAITDILAAHADYYEINERLHAVPPHEVYDVTVDGRRAVCKLAASPDAVPGVEATVLDHVDRETSIPVPSIIALDEDYFLAEWRADAPSEAAVVTDDVAVRALGRTMARLHEETTFPDYGFPLNGRGALQLDARDAWPAVVRDYLRERRRYLERVGYGEECDLVVSLLGDAPHLLDGAGGPVLCHGNLLPAHVAVEDGRPTCVIDFEHALVAPPEYDYWRTAMPVFEGGSDHGVPESVFRDGYESVRSLPNNLDRRRQVYRLVNFVSYLEALDRQNHGIGGDERPIAEGMVRTIRDDVEELRAGLGI